MIQLNRHDTNETSAFGCDLTNTLVANHPISASARKGTRISSRPKASFRKTKGLGASAGVSTIIERPESPSKLSVQPTAQPAVRRQAKCKSAIKSKPTEKLMGSNSSAALISFGLNSSVSGARIPLKTQGGQYSTTGKHVRHFSATELGSGTPKMPQTIDSTSKAAPEMVKPQASKKFDSLAQTFKHAVMPESLRADLDAVQL